MTLPKPLLKLISQRKNDDSTRHSFGKQKKTLDTEAYNSLRHFLHASSREKSSLNVTLTLNVMLTITDYGAQHFHSSHQKEN